MSINVENGFKTNLKNMHEIKLFCDRIKPHIIELADNRYQTFIQNCVSEDRTEHPENIKISNAINRWMERRDSISMLQRSDPYVDISFSICFIPVEDLLLGIFYSTQQEMVDFFLKQPEIQSYFYLSNGDKPKMISKDSWKERENYWNKLSTDPIATQGFTIDLISTHSVFPFNP